MDLLLNVAAREKLTTWSEGDGEPVLLLQGFSGLGKSWLGRELVHSASIPAIKVIVPAESFLTQDLLFEIAGGLEELGDYTMTARADGDLLAGFEDTCKTPKLIVIDDFQEMVESKRSKPPDDIMKALSRISLKGGSARVLVISDQVISTDAWQNAIETITLVPPELEQAVSVLDDMLETHGVPDSVPTSLKTDVAKWMGCNPRALQVLAICLRSEPLEDLIDAELDSWAERGQSLSTRLVERLESRMLSRTLARLDSAAIFFLQTLAIYRIPFEKSAFLRHETQVGNVDGLRDKLIDNFLLEHHQGWYSLQPIARLLSLAQLEKNPRLNTQCHEIAAEYYARHFRALDTSQQLRHGKEFVEARHHLIATGQEEVFLRIAARLRRSLLGSIKGRSLLLPTDSRKQNELLAVITAALSGVEGGHGELRYLLARLLLARGLPGDRVVALNQMRLSVRDTPLQDHWILYIRLLGEIEGAEAVKRAASRAVGVLNPSASLQVYVTAAKVLAELHDLPGAIEIGREGLKRTPVDESVPLVQICCSLLLRQNDYQGAVKLTVETLQATSPDSLSYSRAFEAVLFPALARRDVHLLSSLRDDFASGPHMDDQRLLCQGAILQCDGKFLEAAQLWDATPSDYAAIGAQCAFSWLVAGDVEGATSAANRHNIGTNSSSDWLVGVLALRAGRAELAAAAMERIVGRALTSNEISDPNLWLRVWDTVPPAARVYPSYFFPRLPRSLTGLAHDLVRLEHEPSALNEAFLMALPRVPATQTATPAGLVLAEPSDYPAIHVEIVNQVSPNIGSILESKEIVVGERYYTENAGVVGRNAKGKDIQVGVGKGAANSHEDLATLAAELRQLRLALETGAQDADEKRDLEMLRLAETAASSGDKAGAQSHLRQVSKWALGAATGVGTTVAAAALKAAAGL